MLNVLSKVGLSLLMSLLTEKFIKKLVYRALKAAAEQSDTKVDDRLVQDIAEAWEIPESER